ncbi:MAG: hypothetical protein K2G60_05110 [Oscillospiraceae bacterium]|nr:hypothetical protein [Oscillospiraceae bacterium]
MNDFESLELRVSKLEAETKELMGNLNAITLEQVRSVTKLDIVLASLRELKEGLESLKKRPGQFWDKLMVALISAACGALVSFVF